MLWINKALEILVRPKNIAHMETPPAMEELAHKDLSGIAEKKTPP
jgi:hypothetical protein